MPRVPKGVQLGRRPRRGTARALDLLIVAGVLAAAFFGWGLREATRELEAAGAVPAPAAPAPAEPDERMGAAAALLAAGALDAPSLSGAVRLVLDASAAGARVTEIELAPDPVRGMGVAIAADADGPGAVAELLARLGESGETSVISETLRPDGGVRARIDFRLAP